MIEVEGRIRKWGRSLGVVIPKEAIEKEGFKENQKINLIISKQSNILRESFGMLKKKVDVAKLHKECNEELYYD